MRVVASDYYPDAPGKALASYPVELDATSISPRAIGASANVVVCGIAARSGRPISFMRFLRFGLPVMLLTLVISHVYVKLRYF